MSPVETLQNKRILISGDQIKKRKVHVVHSSALGLEMTKLGGWRPVEELSGLLALPGRLS